MIEKNHRKRGFALILAIVFVLFNGLPGFSVMSAQAESVYEKGNYLVNPDFEDGTPFSPATDSHVGNWFYWRNAAITTDEAQSGGSSVKFSGNDSALEQDIPGLQVGMTYVFTIWAKLSAAGNTSDIHTVGVRIMAEKKSNDRSLLPIGNRLRSSSLIPAEHHGFMDILRRAAMQICISIMLL